SFLFSSAVTLCFENDSHFPSDVCGAGSSIDMRGEDLRFAHSPLKTPLAKGISASDAKLHLWNLQDCENGIITCGIAHALIEHAVQHVGLGHVYCACAG